MTFHDNTSTMSPISARNGQSGRQTWRR